MRVTLTKDPASHRRMQTARADDAIIQGLVDGLDRLIDDVGLTRPLGDQAREEIATGRFVIARRNAALRDVYARALEGSGR
jgi:ClpP class serine protease